MFLIFCGETFEVYNFYLKSFIERRVARKTVEPVIFSYKRCATAFYNIAL
jgi:hypothetical protein